jgi:hypothetical protein
MYLQINTIKYDANWEITNIYENLQIVRSQFCTDFLLFIYIWSTSNIYLFLGIQIRCQQIQTNSYSVTFGYSQYLVQQSMNDPKGRKTTIRCYLVLTRQTRQVVGAINQSIFLIRCQIFFPTLYVYTSIFMAVKRTIDHELKIDNLGSARTKEIVQS